MYDLINAGLGFGIFLVGVGTGFISGCVITYATIHFTKPRFKGNA